MQTSLQMGMEESDEEAHILQIETGTQPSTMRRLAIAGPVMAVLAVVGVLGAGHATGVLDVQALQVKAAKTLPAWVIPNGWGQTPKDISTNQKLRQAYCALNTVQAAHYMARAGLQIDAATKTCTNPDSQFKQEACASDAAGIIASIGYIATYLSQAVSQCNHDNPDITAVCAASGIGIASSLSTMANGASQTAANCVGFFDLLNSSLPADFQYKGEKNALAESDTDAVWQPDRRLHLEADAALGTASCFFDVYEVAAAFAVFGTSIQASSRGCPNKDKADDAYNAELSAAVQDAMKNKGMTFSHAVEYAKEVVPTAYKDTMEGYCMVPITELMNSLTQAITFITMSISHCQTDKYDVRATCTAGISGLLDGVSFLAWQATQAKLACSDLKTYPITEPLAKQSVLEVGQGTI
mmetsp:Transcript_79797/g.140846  ORF Transcript_79797/g.140846 Transcript_79797/m.140846 type:complete len:412 (-) Transcript_79797:237-1472(-)